MTLNFEPCIINYEGILISRKRPDSLVDIILYAKMNLLMSVRKANVRSGGISYQGSTI